MNQLRGPVAVTGAGGFVGSHIVRHLASCGWDVRAVTRSAHIQFDTPRVRLVRIPGLERDALRTAFVGARAVLHLAAAVHAPERPASYFDEVNVAGTGRLLDAVHDAQLEYVFFMSSVAVLDDRPHVDDVTPLRPRTPYGRSKLRAENLVRQAVESGVCQAAIARPPGIYGPGMPGNLARLQRLVHAGIPLPVPYPPVRRSLIYIGNLCHAVEAMLQRGPTATFVMADPEALTIVELLEAMAASVGRKPRYVLVPPALLNALGRFGDALKQRRVPFPLSSSSVALFTKDLVVDSTVFWRWFGRPAPYSPREAWRGNRRCVGGSC